MISRGCLRAPRDGLTLSRTAEAGLFERETGLGAFLPSPGRFRAIFGRRGAARISLPYLNPANCDYRSPSLDLASESQSTRTKGKTRAWRCAYARRISAQAHRR
ncbi:hypothetical protein PT2222_230034 [Paraburkholderia tropica]